MKILMGAGLKDPDSILDPFVRFDVGTHVFDIHEYRDYGFENVLALAIGGAGYSGIASMDISTEDKWCSGGGGGGGGIHLVFSRTDLPSNTLNIDVGAAGANVSGALRNGQTTKCAELGIEASGGFAGEDATSVHWSSPDPNVLPKGGKGGIGNPPPGFLGNEGHGYFDYLSMSGAGGQGGFGGKKNPSVYVPGQDGWSGSLLDSPKELETLGTYSRSWGWFPGRDDPPEGFNKLDGGHGGGGHPRKLMQLYRANAKVIDSNNAAKGTRGGGTPGPPGTNAFPEGYFALWFF